MTIAYFAHELADAAVQRRLRMLAAAGREVTLLGFHRERGDAVAPPSGAYVLGRTRNRALAGRVGAVIAAIPKVLRLKPLWRDTDLIIARNLEMFVLVMIVTRIARPRARIVYECLDIHRLMLDPGPAGQSLRWIERWCLREVALVVTSSPAFEERHFRRAQRYAGQVLLAENKILALDRIDAPKPHPSGGPPWLIAWCGVLRCKRSFELLRNLAESEGQRVRIELWGAPALDEIPDFHAALAGIPNMVYRGRYVTGDLASIYGAAHFAWAIDFYEAGGNSDLLLPNRLYESLGHGAVPIAVANVETARWLVQHKVGVVLELPIEDSLKRFIHGLQRDCYEDLQAAVVRLDPGLTHATPQACRTFADQLAGAAA
jgi:hypothetical protein